MLHLSKRFKQVYLLWVFIFLALRRELRVAVSTAWSASFVRFFLCNDFFVIFIIKLAVEILTDVNTQSFFCIYSFFVCNYGLIASQSACLIKDIGFWNLFKVVKKELKVLHSTQQWINSMKKAYFSSCNDCFLRWVAFSQLVIANLTTVFRQTCVESLRLSVATQKAT